MFEFAAEWETPINIVFLAATGAVAWHGLRARNADGSGQADAGALPGRLRDVVIVKTGREAGKCTRRHSGASRNLQNSYQGRGYG